MDMKTLCTCDNKECQNNPVNQSQGCTPCIAMNLACNAIPRCFFHRLGCKSEEVHTWTFEEFAMKVVEAGLKEKGLA